MTPPVPRDIETPAYICDVSRLKENMRTIKAIKARAGCRILLATKSFALPAAFPFMRDALDGTTASGLYEARLGREEFGKEVHVYSPAYKEDQFEDILSLSDDIYFNSIEQLTRFGPRVRAAGKKIGLRINPGYSRAEIGGDLYNPCAPYSRFGVTEKEIDRVDWSNVDVLHAHALCESLDIGSVGLVRRLIERYGHVLEKVSAVNLGGGHVLCKPEYNLEAFYAALRELKERFKLDIILEPGNGLVYETGYLAATVITIAHNEKDIAILDASASCHMPDVLEVPYRPHVMGSGKAGEMPHTYILAGNTCMTGDVIGEYSFSSPLKPGDRLFFSDLMQYSFVKNTTFNGIPLPALSLLHEDGTYEKVKEFGYSDFRKRLG